jgi:hypothetical protein
MSHAKDGQDEDRSPKIRVTVVSANRYAFDTEVVTGRQIKEKANLPEGFALYRRTRGGNESIRDDDRVELHDGDHFFARLPGSPRAPAMTTKRPRDEREPNIAGLMMGPMKWRPIRMLGGQKSALSMDVGSDRRPQ